MTVTIKNKNSNTATNTPGSTLSLGEIALNHADKKVFVRKSDGSGNESLNTWINTDAAIEFVVDGGGSAITTGVKCDIEVPFACTIVGWTIMGDQSGSITFDLWKDTYANFPPVVGDAITGSAHPLISGAAKGQSSTLTGWTTTLAAGDILRLNVDSITTMQRATLSLKVKRT